MLEPIPFAGMVEIDESFDRTASHMANEYVSYNEPVAWIKKKEIGYMEVTKKCGAKDYATNLGLVPEDDDIPLYTHPVKELTDDEIVDIGTEFLAPKDCDIYTFARAILRKAQEK
jgi:rubrerythrin